MKGIWWKHFTQKGKKTDEEKIAYNLDKIKELPMEIGTVKISTPVIIVQNSPALHSKELRKSVPISSSLKP